MGWEGVVRRLHPDNNTAITTIDAIHPLRPVRMRPPLPENTLNAVGFMWLGLVGEKDTVRAKVGEREECLVGFNNEKYNCYVGKTA